MKKLSISLYLSAPNYLTDQNALDDFFLALRAAGLAVQQPGSQPSGAGPSCSSQNPPLLPSWLPGAASGPQPRTRSVLLESRHLPLISVTLLLRQRSQFGNR